MKVKILAVCGFGVGSSMVLKMTIEKALRELNVTAEVENTDLTSAGATACDAILTSEELLENLRGSCTCPIYPIKRYMDKQEVKAALEQFLREYGN